jgi:hypothetical protein
MEVRNILPLLVGPDSHSAKMQPLGLKLKINFTSVLHTKKGHSAPLSCRKGRQRLLKINFF